MASKLERILGNKIILHCVLLVPELIAMFLLWYFLLKDWEYWMIIFAVLFFCLAASIRANVALVAWLNVLPDRLAKRRKRSQKAKGEKSKKKHPGGRHSSHADTKSSSVSHHSG